MAQVVVGLPGLRGRGLKRNYNVWQMKLKLSKERSKTVRMTQSRPLRESRFRRWPLNR